MSRLPPDLARAVDQAVLSGGAIIKHDCDGPPAGWDDVPPHVLDGPPLNGEDRGAGKTKPKAAPTVDFDAATLDLAALDGRTPPPRRYAWEPWIPAGAVTLLHGFGGVGKSLLAQQIATTYATGHALFGGFTEGRPALVIAGEDDHDELWRRQRDICQRLGCAMGELDGRLVLVAAPHLDLTLAEASESGAIQPTITFDAIRAIIKRVTPGLVVLDNSAKLFAVKEGDRIAVTRCVGMLQSLCHDFDASVLLIAHNNKLGEFSGSTAWENACRSRLPLSRNDDETLTLARPKANYAALGEIKLRWERGSFRCEDEAGMTYAERISAEQERRQHAEVFLKALDTLTEQGRAVSHSNRAGNYAPKLMLEAKLIGDLSRKQLEAAMELLFEEGRIEAGAKVGQRQQRSPQYGIARTGQ